MSPGGLWPLEKGSNIRASKFCMHVETRIILYIFDVLYKDLTYRAIGSSSYTDAAISLDIAIYKDYNGHSHFIAIGTIHKPREHIFGYV